VGLFYDLVYDSVYDRVYDRVYTLFTASDFGRTLLSNGNGTTMAEAACTVRWAVLSKASASMGRRR
jgi:hypothetical protein